MTRDRENREGCRGGGGAECGGICKDFTSLPRGLAVLMYKHASCDGCTATVMIDVEIEAANHVDQSFSIFASKHGNIIEQYSALRV